MAIFKCQVSNISRGNGRSVVAAAAYRSGSKFRDENSGKLHNYSRKKVDFSVIHCPGNCPDWMSDRSRLWNEVEKVEKRKDARLAKEIMVALPTELDHQQKINLAQRFALINCVYHGMIADLNFHDLDSHNPHCHILLTTRHVTAEGFGKKNREWNEKKLLVGWRKAWENEVNRALTKANSKSRISCKSNQAQELDRIPQIELSTAEWSMMQRGNLTYRAEKYQEIEKANQKIEAQQVKRLEAEYQATKLEIQQLQVEEQQEIARLKEIERVKAIQKLAIEATKLPPEYHQFLPNYDSELQPTSIPPVPAPPKSKPVKPTKPTPTKEQIFLDLVLTKNREQAKAMMSLVHKNLSIAVNSNSVQVFDKEFDNAVIFEAGRKSGKWKIESRINDEALDELIENFSKLSDKPTPTKEQIFLDLVLTKDKEEAKKMLDSVHHGFFRITAKSNYIDVFDQDFGGSVFIAEKKSGKWETKSRIIDEVLNQLIEDYSELPDETKAKSQSQIQQKPKSKSWDLEI